MLFLESLDDVIPAPAGTFQIDGTPSRPEPGWVWRTMSPIRGEIQLERNAYERLPPEAPAPIDTELPKNALGDLRALLLPYARKIVAGTRTPREKAERIAHFFQAHFKYSLRTDLRGREPPLIVLIRDRRPAYCIYFASAMAALLRSLDIPARLVTGFVPSETNPIDGRTIVRLRDAHAWVEVYLPSEGRYVSFDPTPPESREALLGLGRMGWVKGIILAARSALRRAWLALKQNPVGTVAAALRSPFVAVPVCGLALWIVWRRRRLGPRKKHQGALRSGDKALRTAYRKYLKQLARAGLTPSQAETDDELLDRLTAARGLQVRQAAEAFVWAYRRARYADVDTREELQGLLKRLEVELKAA